MYGVCKSSSQAQGGYNYLMKEEKHINGVDDAQAYHRLKASMMVLGMNAEEEINQVMRLLSAILLLGNIEFEDHGLDQRATIAEQSTEAFQDVAALLQVDETALEWSLTSHLLPSTKNSRELGRRVKDRVASLFNRYVCCQRLAGGVGGS